MRKVLISSFIKLFTLKIILAVSICCFAQEAPLEVAATQDEQAPPADTVLQSFSTDELVKFKKYYQAESEKLLKEKDKLLTEGIQLMEAFGREHPRSPNTDKVLIRLADLYYQHAVRDFTNSMDEYGEQMQLHDRGELSELSPEPQIDYAKSLVLYQQLIDNFSNSNLVDDAIYNKAFLLDDMGQRDEAFLVFEELVRRYPDSRYMPDAYMRMAEYKFNPPVNDVETAIALYNKVLEYKESPRYDAALYRLGWAYYKLSDYPSAIAYFTVLTDDIDRVKKVDPQQKYHFPAVRDEGIEYIGISFLDYGGPGRAADYFNKIGSREYGFAVLKKIADSHMFVKEEYQLAIQAYQLLLELYPDSFEAPKIHAQIAQAYRHLDDNENLYARRAELFNQYKSQRFAVDVESKDNQKQLNELAAKALRDNIALSLNQAEKSGDESFYLQSIKDSRDYLESFPTDSNAILIHWNMAVTLDTKLGKSIEAFDEFIKISNSYSDSTYQKKAADNAIAVLDEVLRQENKALTIEQIHDEVSSTVESKIDSEAPENLNDNEQMMVLSLDNYIKLFPHDPETPKILSKAGGIFYERRQFPEAIKYFKTLVKHYPQTKEANYARFITMESYFGKSDYKSAEIVAKQLKGGDPEFAAKANKRLAESIFYQARSLAESSDHTKAAQEYLRTVEESPDVEFADLALYNAALEFEKAKDFRSAVSSYLKLQSNYPQSEHQMKSLNNLAFDYRELKDYSNAGQTYENVSEKEADPEAAQAALYNASVSYVQGKNWQQAIVVNNKFVDRYPDADDAADLLFDNAQYYLKLNDFASVNQIYATFTQKFPESPRVVEAFYQRGIYFKKNNRIQEAKTEFENLIAKNDKLMAIGKETNEFYVSEALFQIAEFKFDEFKNIKFGVPGSQLANNKSRKKRLLQELISDYSKVASYGTIRVYESTYQIGNVYEEFARTWAEQEIAVTDNNKRIMALNKINNSAAELYAKAVDSYKSSAANLQQLMEKHKSSFSAKQNTGESGKLAAVDSTSMVASKWISKSKDKVSENLYTVAELHYESVNQFLKAPIPAGLSSIEELVYRNEVLVKAVKPVIDKNIQAHIRNINESAELNLKNQWVDLSKEKIVYLNDVIPNQVYDLAMEATKKYQSKVASYETLISKADDSAFDASEEMASLLKLSSSYSMASAKFYTENIITMIGQNNGSFNLQDLESHLIKSSFEYGDLTSSLAADAKRKRIHFEKRFNETENPDFEDAYFTYDDLYFSLNEASQNILQYAYEISEELKIENQWSNKVLLALIQTNPQEFASKGGLKVNTDLIFSSSEWMVTSEPENGWTQLDFDDSHWSNAYNEGAGSKLVKGDVKSIWLIDFDPRQFAAMDSSKSVKNVSTTEAVSRVELADVLKRPEKVHFRRTFYVDGLPVSGNLKLFLDDSYKLFVNGEEIANSSETQEVQSIDITDYLQSGKNVVALEVEDTDNSKGGFEAVLEIKNLPDWNRLQKETN